MQVAAARLTSFDGIFAHNVSMEVLQMSLEICLYEALISD